MKASDPSPSRPRKKLPSSSDLHLTGSRRWLALVRSIKALPSLIELFPHCSSLLLRQLRALVLVVSQEQEYLARSKPRHHSQRKEVSR